MTYPLLLAAAGAALLVLVAGPAARAWLRERRRSHRNRRKLWELFYSFDWGEVTTNNYGFAPADGADPERHQKQMYRELVRLLEANGPLAAGAELLEVSCGRGGGLAHVAGIWPGGVNATGLDLSQNALAACRRRFGDVAGLSFVHGSALALPFADAAFDVVLNVEASNDYGDYAGFFREVRRVLRPGGAFLYCDTRRVEMAADVERALRQAGLIGRMHDITPRVLEACRLDGARRLSLIHGRAPWWARTFLGGELRNYAATPGSAKFTAFETRKRLYVMTCAIRVDPTPAATPKRVRIPQAVI